MPSNKKPYIIILSALAYDNLLRGRPWAITSELIRQNYRVVFVEPPVSFIRYMSDKKFQIKKLKKYFLKRVIFNDNLTVITQIPIIPFGGYFKLIRNINSLLLRLRFKALFNSLNINIKDDVFIVGEPWWQHLLSKWNCPNLCYDCIDEPKVFAGGEHKYSLYKKLYIELINSAKLIFASAEALKNDILKIKPSANVVYIPNGVDVKWFKSVASETATPVDLLEIPKPIIGFVGLIWWWIDMELIYEIASQLKEYSFVFVGPTRQPLKQHPNIYFLGEKPYYEIPAYVKSFDVCLAPFKVDKVGDSASPLKIFEYLALGKPIVSTNTLELQRLKEHLYIALDKKEFISYLHLALKENPNLKIEREKYIESNSWEVRTKELLKEINKLIKRFP